jgi:outer membrane protein assembly factor BamA
MTDAQLNYDYYGTGHGSGKDGLYLPLSMDSFAFLIEPKVGFFKNWFLGPRYFLLKSSMNLDRDKLDGDIPEFPILPDSPINIPEEDLKVQSSALGLRMQRDTRDSQIYPRKGTFLDIKLDFFSSVFGSNRDYQIAEAAFQGYMGFKDKNVIAYRAAVCSTAGDAPFYSLCMLGKSQDIRGYPVGRYQDRRMLVGQIEYRRELFWRLGVVGYLGAGQVAKTFKDFNMENLLPGGGIGARITVAKQNHINLRIDYAWGKDSNAFYVAVVEAF